MRLRHLRLLRHKRAEGANCRKCRNCRCRKVSARANRTPAKVGADDAATASRWWLIHYHHRDPVEVVCYPESTHAKILERYPDAIAAEPFTPTIRQPSAPLTASEEAAIRAWLALIEETDPATIAEVISQCQRDADARDYFTGRAGFKTRPKSRLTVSNQMTTGAPVGNA